MNVCDTELYEFNQIIQTFKQSGIHPNRPIIPIPRSIVWLLTRIAGFLLPKKKQWLHSVYEKLTQDLVFDNTKMLNTCPTSLSLSRGGRAGFTPKHTLQTIYNPQITPVPSAGATPVKHPKGARFNRVDGAGTD